MNSNLYWAPLRHQNWIAVGTSLDGRVRICEPFPAAGPGCAESHAALFPMFADCTLEVFPETDQRQVMEALCYDANNP